MNTFLDLQATDLELMLQIQPVGDPQVKITINHTVVYHNHLTQPLKIAQQLPLLEPFVITVELLSKDYHSAQETAVVIEQLAVDGFELVPEWIHLARYDNDHQQANPTNYLGFVGAWSLAVDQPFYQWRHCVTNQGLLLTLDQ